MELFTPLLTRLVIEGLDLSGLGDSQEMRSWSHRGKSVVILTSASATEYVVHCWFDPEILILQRGRFLKSEGAVGLLEGSLESLTSMKILLTWPCSIDDRSTGWAGLAILGCHRLCKERAPVS